MAKDPIKKAGAKKAAAAVVHQLRGCCRCCEEVTS